MGRMGRVGAEGEGGRWMGRSSHSLAKRSLWPHNQMQNCKDRATIKMEVLVPGTACLTKRTWGQVPNNSIN